MAARRGLDDMESLRAALPFPQRHIAHTASANTSPVPVKVMLWNIHGDSSAGLSGIRNELVPTVVHTVNPDIILLQETKTDKLVNKIIENRGLVGRYEQVQASDKTKSRILYAARNYTEIPQNTRIFPQQSERKTHTLETVLRTSMVPRDRQRRLNHTIVQNATKIFEDNLSIVGLRHRELPESPIVIFLSFQNFYKFRCAVKMQIAQEFCQLVSKIQELTGCVVVGGGGLNYQPDNSFEFGVTDYEPTERRRSRKKLDYFVIAPQDSAEEDSVEALNFISTEQGEILHPLMSTLLRPLPNGDVPDIYNKALRHDPLVYDLIIQRR